MNPNKAKGDRAERAARDWYRINGAPDAERTRAGYERDYGDLRINPRLMAQVKDCKTLRWGEWLTQLDEQKRNGRFEVAWLLVKRPGMGDPGEWLAVMTVRDHWDLVRRSLYAPRYLTDDEPMRG